MICNMERKKLHRSCKKYFILHQQYGCYVNPCKARTSHKLLMNLSHLLHLLVYVAPGCRFPHSQIGQEVVGIEKVEAFHLPLSFILVL